MKELTITIKADPKANPSLVGELLRDMFFEREYGLPGGYNRFNLRNTVKVLPSEPVDSEYPEDDEYRCSELDNIKMRYYFDGDMQLEFLFNDGSCLINSDAKKSYNWLYYDSFPNSD